MKKYYWDMKNSLHHIKIAPLFLYYTKKAKLLHKEHNVLFRMFQLIPPGVKVLKVSTVGLFCDLRGVCVCVCVCVCVSHSVMSDSLWPPWTTAHQAPLSMEFSRQEYWTGLSFPSPGDWTWLFCINSRSLPSEPPGKSFDHMWKLQTYLHFHYFGI